MDILYSIPDTYDYYAFSDQDDIWEKDKLITAIRHIRDESGCVLYASNLECVDENNRHIGMRFEPDWKTIISLLSIILSNMCYGCTMVFNKQLFLLLRCRQPSEQILDTRYHDEWIAASAAAAGHIIFDMDSHIRYRRHGKNCTRLSPTKAEQWKDRLSKLFHEEQKKPRSKTAKEIVRCYPEFVEKDPDCYTIHLLADQRSFLKRLELIKNRDCIISLSKEPDVYFIIKVLFGLV